MKKLCIIVAFVFSFTACQESLEDRCEREAKEFTMKNCPLKMDENTIMDSLTFDRKSLTVCYYYKLCGKADHEGIAEEIDAANILKKELKNTTSLQSYKKAGYNFSYVFRSEKNPETVWINLTFTKDDY